MSGATPGSGASAQSRSRENTTGQERKPGEGVGGGSGLGDRGHERHPSGVQRGKELISLKAAHLKEATASRPRGAVVDDMRPSL